MYMHDIVQKMVDITIPGNDVFIKVIDWDKINLFDDKIYEWVFAATFGPMITLFFYFSKVLECNSVH